jgi:hypothetical protein
MSDGDGSSVGFGARRLISVPEWPEPHWVTEWVVHHELQANVPIRLEENIDIAYTDYFVLRVCPNTAMFGNHFHIDLLKVTCDSVERTLLSNLDMQVLFCMEIGEHKINKPYAGFCDIFTSIRDKCHNISDHFGQLAALGSSWWLIDSITDTLFGGIATFFSELGDFFEMLYDWCVAVTSALGEALDMATVAAYLNSQFHLAELWQWLSTRDDWLLAQKDTVVSWVLGSYSSLDEWLATKDFPTISEILGGFASLDDWLDGQSAKVKALVLGTFSDLDAWLDGQAAKIKGLILGGYTSLDAWLDAKKATVKTWVLGSYSSLDEWLAARLEYLAGELKGEGLEILDFLLDTVDAWLDARVEKLKAFIEKVIMKL